MRYCGSKRKFMKELLPILMKGTNKDTVFYDVFGGGMNVISEIPLKKKVGLDYDKYTINLWKDLQKYKLEGKPLPAMINDHITKEEYEDVKYCYLNNIGKYTDSEIGYVGYALSYGGAFFNGYAKFNHNRNEDHVKEAYNGLMRHVDNFKNLNTTKFYDSNYVNLNPVTTRPGNVILFCDPPYFGTRKYSSDFDSAQFWEWAIEKAKLGFKVYVCEYEAPSDFKCIWQKEKRDGMGTTRSGQEQTIKTEKMFIYKG